MQRARAATATARSSQARPDAVAGSWRFSSPYGNGCADRSSARPARRTISFPTCRSKATQRIEAATIVRYAGIGAGQAVSAGALNDAYQRIVELGPVRNGRARAAGQHAGDPGRRNSRSSTSSASRATSASNDEKLAELIQSQARRVYSPAQAEADAAAIAEAYRDVGPACRHASTPKIIRRSDNRVDLVFEVQRRPRGRGGASVLRRQPRLFRPPPAAGAGNQAGRACCAPSSSATPSSPNGWTWTSSC